MITFVFALLLASAVPQKQSAPNRCADPQSQAEMNHCSAAEYQKADAELNALYGRLIKDLEKDVSDARRQNDASQLKYAEIGLGDLKEAERAGFSIATCTARPRSGDLRAEVYVPSYGAVA